MRILLVTSAYKSEFNPVNALFFRDQAKALQKGGNQVGLICALPISLKTVMNEKKILFSKEAYNDEGVDTLVQPFFSIPKTPNRTKKKRFSIAKQLFLEYVEKFGLPEILHVHTFLAGELAIWVKEQYGIPYVVTEHSTNFARGNFSQSQLQFSKQVYKNSKSNIAVSNEFCSLLEELTSCKFKYVPNVVDTTFFKPSSEVKNTECFTFLNVAHLDAKKNQAGLIKSFAEQFLGKTKYNLIIAGDGPEKENLQTLISSLGVNSQVSLFGRASREEVLILMQQANCFVLPSFYETFGVVLIEAMACGLPVLSTISGGPESIIKNDDYGYLCHENELAEMLEKMTSQVFNSKAIRDYVQKYFSENAVRKKIESIYCE